MTLDLDNIQIIHDEGKWIIDDKDSYIGIPVILTDEQMDRLVKAKGESL